MTIAASTILDRASKVVMDTTNVRWPTTELIQWLNDGQREIVLHRPDAKPVSAQITLETGTRQKLASGTGAGGVGADTYPAKLLDVICNVGVSGRTSAVRLVQREVLDAQTPSWHGQTGSTTIKHYMTDPRDPLAFYVYPPAASGAKVEILCSAYPKDVTDPVSNSNIDVPDIYANALLDYVLYRAYSKDSEYAGNAQRAQFHYQSFANSLGIELRGTLMMSPMISGATWNPNAAKMGQAAAGMTGGGQG